MKKPTITTKKPVANVKVEQAVATEAPEAKPKKPSPVKTAAKKTQTAAAKPAAAVPEVAIPERVGLTAGNLWHYLAENGTTSVAKLVRELTEEEKIIQRSIGWLAQEGKITLLVIDGVDSVELNQ
ncbi:MAG: winged helix-turn-helix domain-containing protein [Methylococcales bacterium]